MNGTDTSARGTRRGDDDPSARGTRRGSDDSSTARADPILSVESLRTTFYTDRETVRAVDGVSFDVYPGETVGIVGESGSGKSVTARSIMGLIDTPGRIEGGAIRFRGEDLTEKSEKAWRSVRGSGIAMVFQDPMTSLNPVYSVGNQIEEALRLHQGLRGRAATERAIELLEAVGIPDAPRRVDEYPHEFSGGMCQRAVIAMALACDPEVLLCDEPTTALDVTIQAQILELLQELQAERDLAIVFITHDMGVIAEIADRVNVMYAGEIVESAPVEELYANPKHPYTVGLLESIPGTHERGERLRTIEGEVPTPNEPARDCRFAPRCPEAFDACEKIHPASVPVAEDAEDHTAACLLYPEGTPREQALARHRSGGEAPTASGVDEPPARDGDDGHDGVERRDEGATTRGGERRDGGTTDHGGERRDGGSSND